MKEKAVKRDSKDKTKSNEQAVCDGEEDLMTSFSAKVKMDVDILRERWVTSVHATTRTVWDCKERRNIKKMRNFVTVDGEGN